MNIKKAKEDIKNTVRAYLKKNDYGQYSIPSIRQRPMLLMGPPGIGKTQIMQQIAQECNIGLVHIPSLTTPDKVLSDCHLLKKKHLMANLTPSPNIQ